MIGEHDRLPRPTHYGADVAITDTWCTAAMAASSVNRADAGVGAWHVPVPTFNDHGVEVVGEGHTAW